MSTTSLRRRGFGGTSAAKDYIKDGLVFHLDGSDLNTVTHKWIDRIGGIVFDMSNGVTRNDAGNGVVFVSGSRGYCDGSFPYSDWDVANGRDCTIETVYRNTGDTYSIISDTGASTVASLVTIVRSNSIRCIRKDGHTWPVSDTDVKIMSLSDNLCVQNGNVKASNGSYSNAGGSNDKIWIGVQYLNTNTNAYFAQFIGTIYQIRIYNRILTEDEILHNQAIDIAKYSIE